MKRALRALAITLLYAAAPAAATDTDAPRETGPAPPIAPETSASPEAPPAPIGSTVSGVVNDAAGHPVEGAVVRLSAGVRGETVAAREARTGRDGGFVFEEIAPGRWRLTVASGFAAARRTLRVGGSAIEVRVVLPGVGAGLLETVTVTPSRSGEPLIGAAADVRVLGERDLRTSAAVRVDDVLRQVPGFTLFRRTGSAYANPTIQGASLRGIGGSGAGRLLILQDGLPLNDPFGGWVAWGRVPRASIAQIDVLQGGSSLYGMSALAGAVQVLTRPPSPGGVVFEGSGGNLGTADATLWAGGAHGPWQGSIGAEVFRTDGYIPVDSDVRGPVDTRAGSSQRAIEAEGRRTWGPGSSVSARFSWFDESRENGTDFQENSTSWKRLALGWDGALAGEASIRAYASSEGYEQTFSAVSADRTEETPTREQRVPSDAYGLTGQWKRTSARGDLVLAGFEAARVSGVSHEAPASGSGVETRAGGTQTSLAAFGEAQLRLGRALDLTGMLRFDRWTNDPSETGSGSSATGEPAPQLSDSAWSPLLALRADAGRGWSFMGSAYETFRAPTLNELYRSFRVGDVLTLANDTLGAERLRGIEGSTQYAAGSGIFLGKATLFHMEVRDPILNVTLDTDASPILRERRNLGRTVSEGCDLTMDVRLSYAWSATLGALFTHAVVVEAPGNETLEGKRIPLVPEQQATLQVRYGGRIFGASAQARWSGEVFDDDLNTLTLASAFTLDGLASVRFSEALEVFVAGENLLDERVETGRTPVLTVGPPKTWRAGLRIHTGSTP